jgi:TPP-dependent pyruvate/acetoin dehydrogenase alpha subunit
MHGHSAADDASYVPKGMVEEWKKKDPIERFERVLVNDRVLTDDRKTEMEAKISAEIEDAIAYALESPYPPGEQAIDGVYAP